MALSVYVPCSSRGSFGAVLQRVVHSPSITELDCLWIKTLLLQQVSVRMFCSRPWTISCWPSCAIVTTPPPADRLDAGRRPQSPPQLSTTTSIEVAPARHVPANDTGLVLACA